MSTIVDAPARADDLVLLGTTVGSGYRTPPALVRRGDGQTLQLTPLLYAVLEAVDGQRTCEQIAAVVREETRRGVTGDTVATLIDQHLRPLGLLKLTDGSEPPVKRSNPLLGLKFRYAVTDPRATRRLTDPFRILFRPVLVALVLAGFLGITWWVFFHRGLGPSAYDAFQRPHLLLLVFVVTVLSGGFHEFGHAAAARYGGASPGVMGAGLYVVWPAFYTDVTDSYRLGRRGRIRTDLGGLYFNAIVVVLTFAWWYATRWDAVLLLVATQTLQMVQQLMPTMRFDGYHLLADVTGVPDLYHRIRPTLVGLLPHRWSDPQNRVLKPWARLVITVWVLVTVPLMAFMLLAVVTSLPRVIGSAWSAVGGDLDAVGQAWRSGGAIDVAANVLQVFAVVLPVFASLVIFGRVSLRWGRKLVRWSRDSMRKRVAAVAVIAVVITGLAWAWAPRPGNYRPIGKDEKGLLTAVLPGTQHSTPATRGTAERAPTLLTGGSAERRLRDGSPLEATFEKGRDLPSRRHPQLALVLVPAEHAGGDGTRQGGRAGQQGSDDPWVFPFDKPLPPGEGDNQAAAYNTTDDSTVYDVAFALVWATGDEVLNVNEARAYASCSNCVTVAVAFQVVLIMDNAHVVVPQNLAVAADYDCYRCITAAIANQLVLSVTNAPTDEKLMALGAIWAQLLDFGKHITSYSLAQVTAQLEDFKAQIVALLGSAPAMTPGPTPMPSATPSDGATAPPVASAPSSTADAGDPAASDPTSTVPSGSGSATSDEAPSAAPSTASGAATASSGTADGQASSEPVPSAPSDPVASP